MKIGRQSMNSLPRHQQGVVLVVVLLLLLLTTIVGFQVMETSSLEARMATAREASEVSFQAAESVIDQAKNDEALLVQAFVNGLGGLEGPDSDAFVFGGDARLRGCVLVRYIDEIPTLGNDLVIGNPGLRSLHFELRADVNRTIVSDAIADDPCLRDDDTARFDSTHIQGIKRFAPKLL